MPLGAAYDKIIDSKFADMKNSGGRYGGVHHSGAIPPAFRRRNPLGASRYCRNGHVLAQFGHQPELGFGLGVRLLDRLVSDHYEG